MPQQPFQPQVQINAGCIICDGCKQPILRGQRVVEIFIGLSDSNPVNGEPCISQDPEKGRLNQLHWRCFAKYLVDEVFEDDDDALEPFTDMFNEIAWEIYEQEMTCVEEETGLSGVEADAELRRRLQDPNS